MRVLLINPPRFKGTAVVRETRCAGMSPVSVYPPLKLLSIAGYLRSNKQEVFLIDANGENISFSDLKKKIRNVDPELVILTTSPTTMTFDSKVSNIVKKINKNITVVLDDSHIAPAFPERVLKKFKDIDILIRGESEKTALSIVNNINNLKSVEGISFREKHAIISTPDSKSLDLNSVSFPAYDLINLDNYYSWTFGKENRLVTIMTSVSCPYNCQFCLIGGANIWRGYGKKWLAKKPKRVYEEIKFLKESYDVKNFYFFDETFTVDKKRVEEICNLLIKNNIKINWSCNSRVDTVDLKTLKIMKKAGCWNICFGLESGSQEILDSINKRTNLKQAELIFKYCNDLKIKSSASFMIGLPEDSNETLKQTLDLAKRLNPDRVQFVVTTAYPGTQLYDYVKEHGLLEKDYDFSGFDAYGINNEAVLKTKFLSAKEMVSYQKKMYLGYYLRPKPILKLLSGIKSFEDIIDLIKLAKNL